MKKKTPIQMMEELIPLLPEKDVKFASNFIIKRDFESLSDLVASDIYKLERKINILNKEDNISELSKVMKLLEDYCSLKSIIDEYLTLLGYNNDYEPEEEGFEEDINEYYNEDW